jgi:5-methylcytosine-specific restriction enzyme A
MSKQPPNFLQRMVRGMIRDLINHDNTQKAEQQQKQKSKKIKKKVAKKLQTEQQVNESRRSRYISPSVRVSVLHRDSYKCVFCGRGAPQIQLEVDRIVPFSKGGNNLIENLQTLCLDCNRGKGSRHLK